MKHLFTFIDGVSKSATVSSGPIGQYIDSENLQDMPVKKFKKIPLSNDFPIYMQKEGEKYLNEYEMELNKDQSYLFKIVTAISEGKVEENLRKTKVGKRHQARWITTASRLARLYVSADESLFQENCDEDRSISKKIFKQLKILVTFVVRCYSHVWFTIKQKQYIENGTKNFYLMCRLTRYMGKEERNKIDSVLRNNSHFAHSENVLLAMLSDTNCKIKEKAIDVIFRIRKEKEEEDKVKSKIQSRSRENKKIRKFVKPEIELNIEAKEYYKMIDLKKRGLSEPPLTLSLKTREEFGQFKPPRYYCHNQHIEKKVQLSNKVANTSYDPEKRLGNAYIIEDEILSKPNYRTKKNIAKNLLNEMQKFN